MIQNADEARCLTCDRADCPTLRMPSPDNAHYQTRRDALEDCEKHRVNWRDRALRAKAALAPEETTAAPAATNPAQVGSRLVAAPAAAAVPWERVIAAMRAARWADLAASGRPGGLGGTMSRTADAAATAFAGQVLALHAEVARLTDALARAEERLAMATRFDLGDGYEMLASFAGLLVEYPAPWSIVEGGHCLRDANGQYIASYDPHGRGPWRGGAALAEAVNFAAGKPTGAAGGEWAPGETTPAPAPAPAPPEMPIPRADCLPPIDLDRLERNLAGPAPAPTRDRLRNAVELAVAEWAGTLPDPAGDIVRMSDLRRLTDTLAALARVERDRP